MSIEKHAVPLPKVRRTLISIARRTENNPKVREDLNVPPCGSHAIKVLTDLEKRRDAFSIDIKDLMDLKMSLLCIHEPLSKRAATGKSSARFACSAQHPKSKPQVWKTCMSIARRTAKKAKVRRT